MTLCILVASWNLGQPLLVGSSDRLPVFSSDSPRATPLLASSCHSACLAASRRRTYANASFRHLRAFNYFRANLCSLECYNWVWIVSMNMKICENLIKLYVLTRFSSCCCPTPRRAVTNCFNSQKHLNNLLIKYVSEHIWDKQASWSSFAARIQHILQLPLVPQILLRNTEKL